MSLKPGMCGLVTALSLVALSANAETYKTFSTKDFPTTAAGINDAGDVIGVFQKGKRERFTVRGFLRSASGHVSRIIVTGAAVTSPVAINDAGTVVGTHSLKGQSSHGFVRTPDKNIVEFDSDQNDIVLPVAVNASGTALAVLWDGIEKGAIRSPGGTVTKFQAPMAGEEQPATVPTSLNTDGEAVGYATTSDQHSRGFIRTPDGTITMFDAPGAGSGNSQGTFPQAVNSDGTVAGYYTGADNVSHEFLRTSDGTFTSFDVAGSIGAGVNGLNDAGTITGVYVDSSGGRNFSHGYVRAADGTITKFDVPGARGTTPSAINSSGQIVGAAFFDGGVTKAFIRNP